MRRDRSAARLERLIALTGNRALTGFTAPKLLSLREHEPAVYGRIRHVLLPKDYVRYRLTGRVRDRRRGCVRDAALRRCGAALVGRGLRRARDPARLAAPCPSSRRRSAPPAIRPLPPRRRGRLPRRRVGCAWHLGGRLRAAPGLPARPAGPRPCVLPRPAGQLARDGCDAQRRGLACLAPAHPRRRSRELTAEADRWPAGSEGLQFARISPASARRTRIRAHAARSPGSRCGTTVARLSGQRWRESPTVSGTRSSSSATSESTRTAPASRAAARRSALWRRIVASVLGLRLESTESEAGSAFGAALLAGVRAGEFADIHGAVARCVRVRATSTPIQTGPPPTRPDTTPTGPLSGAPRPATALDG